MENGCDMVYLMHGFIGSGKTTKAKELEQTHNAIRITPDDWMAELFGIDPPAETFQRRLATLLELLKPMWIKAAKAGIPVILDYGFWTKQSREEIQNILQSLQISFEWVRMQTSMDECRKRNHLRNKNRGGSLYIADNTFDLLRTRFEPM